AFASPVSRTNQRPAWSPVTMFPFTKPAISPNIFLRAISGTPSVTATNRSLSSTGERSQCIEPFSAGMGGTSLGYHPPALYNGHPVGAWRSLVARIVRDDEVGGSNPLAPTITTNRAPFHASAHPWARADALGWTWILRVPST